MSYRMPNLPINPPNPKWRCSKCTQFKFGNEMKQGTICKNCYYGVEEE